MKVLFAVNNESISESIIKRYQQDYKEIISAKNVYYFNAIIKELQKDKTYDRIVISEDLEPFSNNNYEAIDKFIFDKMDNISDEATNQSGNDIPIVFICADRREKSEALLVKLFGIGIYNALIGKDRSLTNVCELLNKPRGKKEAKVYYRIDSENVDYKVENEGDVSEVEIQNILNYYKKLGRNEEKYVESFEHIASQYTDSQLRLIAKFLPLNVKAVLEANSKTYQEVVSFGSGTSQTRESKHNNYEKEYKSSDKYQKKEQEQTLNIIENNLKQNRITEPVIIPTAIDATNVRKISTDINMQNNIHSNETNLHMVEQEQENNRIDLQPEQEVQQEEILTAQPKRRGRPKKIQTNEQLPITNEEEPKKRGRGRPKKITADNVQQENISENINNIGDSNTPLNLFELGEEDNNITNIANTTNTYSDMILPGLEEKEETNQNVFGNSTNTANFDNHEPNTSIMQNNSLNNGTQTQSIQNVGKYNLTNVDLSGLLSRDKKIVAFVGTSKNGTSFLVNSLAEMLSQQGIKTALLDLTQNKNAYYIYTQNDESLREIAFKSINNLRKGNPAGITVNKNLTVYTTLPGENEDINDYANILETLLKNYSLILLDCDFETNYGYFKEAQEIYLVQSLDILTIQPLTAFLRDLKAKNVLNPEKIRIALNKVLKVRSLTEKTIIGGMAYYNDPAMSFMTELFNKDMVAYCSIPFEEQAYAKYLEGLVNCKISVNGYSKNFMAALSKLANMVYPLIGNGYAPMQNQYNNYSKPSNNFSSSMNNTLNKMKNNY